MVSSIELDHLVLAACACCSLDQVCYSCTYQRIRCKQNLGLFDPGQFKQSPDAVAAAENGWPLMTEFVNIREQCAWVHLNDPPAATAKATALISAAVAKMRIASSKAIEAPAIERSVLIVGRGEAALTCRDHLRNRDIVAQQIDPQVARILRTNGSYTVLKNGHTWSADSIVLAPRDPTEEAVLMTAFGTDSHQPRVRSTWGGLETHLPGVFYCEPAADGLLTGAAAAARVSAWLGRCSGPVKPNTAVSTRTAVGPVKPAWISANLVRRNSWAGNPIKMPGLIQISAPGAARARRIVLQGRLQQGMPAMSSWLL